MEPPLGLAKKKWIRGIYQTGDTLRAVPRPGTGSACMPATGEEEEMTPYRLAKLKDGALLPFLM